MSAAAVDYTRDDPTLSPRQLYDGWLRSTETLGGDQGKISASRGTKEEPLGPIYPFPAVFSLLSRGGFSPPSSFDS